MTLVNLSRGNGAKSHFRILVSAISLSTLWKTAKSEKNTLKTIKKFQMKDFCKLVSKRALKLFPSTLVLSFTIPNQVNRLTHLVSSLLQFIYSHEHKSGTTILLKLGVTYDPESHMYKNVPCNHG